MVSFEVQAVRRDDAFEVFEWREGHAVAGHCTVGADASRRQALVRRWLAVGREGRARRVQPRKLVSGLRLDGSRGRCQSQPATQEQPAIEQAAASFGDAAASYFALLDDSEPGVNLDALGQSKAFGATVDTSETAYKGNAKLVFFGCGIACKKRRWSQKSHSGGQSKGFE